MVLMMAQSRVVRKFGIIKLWGRRFLKQYFCCYWVEVWG